jgi:hypothetical protein
MLSKACLNGICQTVLREINNSDPIILHGKMWAQA